MNSMLWKMIRPEGEEVTGRWRKAHNAELCDFHCLQNVICVCGEIEEDDLDRASGICGG